MATTTFRPLSQSDVAYVLRRKLGPAMSWEDLLADMRRGKSDFHGLVLLPCGVLYGKGIRPVYAARHVEDFIRDARPFVPVSLDPSRDLTPLPLVEADLDHSNIGWRVRKLKPKPGIAARSLAGS